jgi:predicted DNA-binding transcriptional regulator YafY
MNDPTGRALELLSLLQTHRFWTGSELCDRLDVSPRTLRRDVDRLRSLGYPVDATTGVAGGYRLAAGAHLPPLLLDDDEAVAIAVGLRAATASSVEGMEELAVRAMAKLEQVLPDRLRRRVGAVHANVVPLRWGPSSGPVDPDSLATLSIACRDHEQVRFDYERADGELGARLVEPHQLVSGGRRWYLVAFDVRRDDWRTFRVDRMTNPSLAGVRFRERELPAEDAAAFIEQSFGAWRAERSVFVDVVVAAPAGPVTGNVSWLGGEVTPIDDSTCRVTLVGEDPSWLAVGVACLTTEFDITLAEDAPADVVELVEQVAGRMSTRRT